MRKALPVIALLVACSAGSTTDAPAVGLGPEGQAPVSLHNATVHALAYIAAGEGTLALLHIPPTLEFDEYEDRRVEPGRTVPVSDIIGYESGLGVTFYLYRVDPGTREAHYLAPVLATASELARTGGVVTITRNRL